MKNHWLLLATALFPVFPNAQSETNVEEKPISPMQAQGPWSIGLSYSPEASYRFLGIRNGENEATMQSIIDYRNESETFKFGHTAGVQIAYDLNKKISIESGISYTMFGDKTKPSDLVVADGNGVIIIGTSFARNSYHYVSVPLTLNYSFGTRALKYVVSSGISASLAVGQSNLLRIDYPDGGYFESSTSSFGTPSSFHRLALGAHLSAGIEYHFSSKFSMQLAPVFRMTATSVTDAPILGYYFNAGLETGVQWRL